VRDADLHAEDDKRRREEAEVRNQSDTLVYQTEKLLRDQDDKFQGDEKEKVESALSHLKETLNGTDVEQIKNATEALMTASHTFSQRLYEQATSSASGAAGPGGGGDDSADSASDDEVVDAEIVDEPGA